MGTSDDQTSRPASFSGATRYDVPWNYGPYRVVIARRVTEEEQISVECYEPTRERAEETYTTFMSSMRQQMIEHNERVVLVHTARLTNLERMIENRAEEVRLLDEACEERRAWLLAHGVVAPDMPPRHEDGNGEG